VASADIGELNKVFVSWHSALSAEWDDSLRLPVRCGAARALPSISSRALFRRQTILPSFACELTVEWITTFDATEFA
jgi:hypothetical protein